ncbi:rRNA methyltransferase [Candidatus Micrarchaeota archaeon CG10_big_fil_rev_8_21_14_0_10_45_29]|nr:MAG: rRNA methyltransferase [Candidatus Micrarchaeota archaeon CG10_big_fil_rev_8_21_14_0_10_45_29]
MPKFRFVLIEPEYEMNLGAAARLMKNFSQKPLYLVNPDCHIGFTARMHSKHAFDILKKAKICKNIEEAVKGCEMVVGTSGILHRHKQVLRHPITIREFKEKATSVKGEVAILFGREGIGLRKEEIEKCDLLITIPTSKKYPIMNLSHAMAIVLYELCASRKRAATAGERENEGERRHLLKIFDSLVEGAEKMKKPKKAKIAFRRILARAMADELEVRALLAAFSRIEKIKGHQA